MHVLIKPEITDCPLFLHHGFTRKKAYTTQGERRQ